LIYWLSPNGPSSYRIDLSDANASDDKLNIRNESLRALFEHENYAKATRMRTL
jgi:hypothetical protein